MAAPFNQNVELVGLNSYAVSIPNAAPIVSSWKILLPTITDGGGQSSVVMTVVQSGSASNTFTGTAGAQGGSCVFSCAANDVLTYTLSSAAAADQGLNNIKATISISQGVS